MPTLESNLTSTLDAEYRDLLTAKTSFLSVQVYPGSHLCSSIYHLDKETDSVFGILIWNLRYHWQYDLISLWWSYNPTPGAISGRNPRHERTAIWRNFIHPIETKSRRLSQYQGCYWRGRMRQTCRSISMGNAAKKCDCFSAVTLAKKSSYWI